MVKRLKNKNRHFVRRNRHYYQKNIPDKIVVENSKMTYAQYFIIPTIFTIVGIQYFKQNNYEPKFLIFIILGYIFSFGLNVIITRKLRKNPEIVLNNIGITFSKTRTIFWKEILHYNLFEKNSVLRIYVKCEEEEFFVEFKHLPISKVKLKVLFNSFYKKYNGKIKRNYKTIIQNIDKIENVNFDNYMNNTIL